MNYRIPIPQVKEFAPPCYPCQRAIEKHVLDGDLDKSFWQAAAFTEDFVDIEGDLRPTPRFRTRAKMLWDDEAVYFGAELEGDEIWGHITERDSIIFYDNDFEIFIDPDNDTHVYCEFEMNARNTVWDLLLTRPYRDGGFPINSFDIKGLRTAVKIDGELNNPNAANKRWTVEVVIPFESVLECCGQGAGKPQSGTFWRVNFSRVQWQVDVINREYQKRKDRATGNPLPEENWVWAPTGLVNIHYPELWGYLFFCDDKNQSAQLPAEEKVKWEMRKIYYALHQQFDEKGFFDAAAVENPIGAEIHTTASQFEILLRNDHGSLVLQSDSLMKQLKNHD